jgi:spore coat protein H
MKVNTSRGRPELPLLLVGMLVLAWPAACGSDQNLVAVDAGVPPEQTEPADYAAVFPPDRVIRLDVTIAPADWSAMMADMESMAGPFGAGGGLGGGRGPGGPGMIPDGGPDGGFPDGGAFPGGGFPGGGPPGGFPDGGAFPGGGPPGGLPDGGAPGGGLGGGAGVGEFFPRTPVYVPAAVEFEGRRWQNAGIRFKGNSSLSTTWSRGVSKLPFRLDFDELQDRFPEVAKQRLLGFKALSLTNSFSDTSLVREKVMADLFREGGVRAARTVFVRLYIDRGQGSEYFGLYGMAEVPDKAMLRAQFGGSEGNLYKPQGTGAQLRSFDQASFEKKTNEKAGDWSDVQRLIKALNADRSDRGRWRADLEATLDVPGFLRWLAINTIAGNWDVYGQIAHNYYLYGDPTREGRLTWIPWDHDLSMQEGRGGDLMHSSVGTAWPLIRYVMDDPVYRAQYLGELESAISTDGVLNAAQATARLNRAHDLIAPFVVGGDTEMGERPGFTFLNGASAFQTGHQQLVSFVTAREPLVRQTVDQERTRMQGTAP